MRCTLYALLLLHYIQLVAGLPDRCSSWTAKDNTDLAKETASSHGVEYDGCFVLGDHLNLTRMDEIHLTYKTTRDVRVFFVITTPDHVISVQTSRGYISCSRDQDRNYT